MTEVYHELYQFTDYIPPIQLSLHQYLLLTDKPVLIHTGAMKQAEAILPQMKEVLGGRQLHSILVSHFESDECGGLPVFAKAYPNVVTVCSEISARELRGFGYTGAVAVKKQGETWSGEDYAFFFMKYPSEIHLQDGLVFVETKRGIFFSSDLMFRFGDAQGKTIESSWQEEVAAIGLDRVANPQRLEALKEDLLKLRPQFIATGHGPCVWLRE